MPRCVKATLFPLMLLFLPIALAAAEPPAPDAAHEQAARELFDLVGGKDLARTASLAMLNQLKANPELAPYEDVFKTWLDKVWTESDMGQEFVRLYTASFTEDELKQVIAFYKTPVGQKALQKMPELMQQGMAYGQQEAQAHLPELREAIAARKLELEAKEQKNPQ